MGPGVVLLYHARPELNSEVVLTPTGTYHPRGASVCGGGGGANIAQMSIYDLVLIIAPRLIMQLAYYLCHLRHRTDNPNSSN